MRAQEHPGHVLAAIHASESGAPGGSDCLLDKLHPAVGDGHDAYGTVGGGAVEGACSVKLELAVNATALLEVRSGMPPC